jgi:hypothetical protein
MPVQDFRLQVIQALVVLSEVVIISCRDRWDKGRTLAVGLEYIA